jgi:hypothetical protein
MGRGEIIRLQLLQCLEEKSISMDENSLGTGLLNWTQASIKKSFAGLHWASLSVFKYFQCARHCAREHSSGPLSSVWVNREVSQQFQCNMMILYILPSKHPLGSGADPGLRVWGALLGSQRHPRNCGLFFLARREHARRMVRPGAWQWIQRAAALC